MANFPNSVYNPAAKSAGQTITASFFNDPEGEIVAIEQGYLQGTAPLNSSNSTVAALAVTGTLQVTGASTFTVRPVLPPPEFALVFSQSTGTIGSSAASTVAWTAESYVANSSMHSTATNPERLIPQTTGWYQFNAQISISSGSSGVRQVALNDSSNANFAITRLTEGISGSVNVPITGFKRFDQLGGYVTVALSLTGSTFSLSSGVQQTWLSMLKL